MDRARPRAFAGWDPGHHATEAGRAFLPFAERALEAVAEGNKITLRPKSVIDRELALALADVRKGRVVGPFNSAAELLADLHKRVARQTKRSKRAKTA